MAGEYSQLGCQAALNFIFGMAIPVVDSTPPTWIPGRYWIDTSDSNTVKRWNGSAWVAATGNRYVALLLVDPAEGATITDLVELTTSGYQRQLIAWDNASAASPSVVRNSGLVTFGPMSADMADPVVAAALLDVSSGTNGQYLGKWTLEESQQVSASQSIQVATSTLTFSQA